MNDNKLTTLEPLQSLQSLRTLHARSNQVSFYSVSTQFLKITCVICSVSKRLLN